MEKNSSCSRVSARLVMHQLAELQLTAPLKKVLQSFITGPIFPPDSLYNSAGTLSLCCSGKAPVNIQ